MVGEPNGKRTAKIEERCYALAEILKVLRPIYFGASQDQRHFIETTIGAAIWYIPAPSNAWTGYISIEAIKVLIKRRTKLALSQEHVIPRKIAAKELLKRPISDKKVMQSFLERYCKIHYVTPRENKMLVRLQRHPKFIASSRTYGKVGIKLIKISPGQFQQIKHGNSSALKVLLRKHTAKDEQ